jgi:hypothetical protein
MNALYTSASRTAGAAPDAGAARAADAADSCAIGSTIVPAV